MIFRKVNSKSAIHRSDVCNLSYLKNTVTSTWITSFYQVYDAIHLPIYWFPTTLPVNGPRTCKSVLTRMGHCLVRMSSAASPQHLPCRRLISLYIKIRASGNTPLTCYRVWVGQMARPQNVDGQHLMPSQIVRRRWGQVLDRIPLTTISATTIGGRSQILASNLLALPNPCLTVILSCVSVN